MQLNWKDCHDGGTLCPRDAKAMLRLVATLDLPTPTESMHNTFLTGVY